MECISTKTIKAWIDGAVQEIEVEDIVSPEQMPSIEETVESLQNTVSQKTQVQVITWGDDD